jgi:hypothetical protein
MKYTIVTVLLFTALSLPKVARADCPTPSTVGVVICQPSANSVVANDPFIEVNSNPASGSIVSMQVLIDGQQIFQNNGPQLNLFDGGITNGTHKLDIRAQDGLGRIYEAGEFFTVVGNPPSSCAPSSAGVRICWPLAGQFTAQDFSTAIGFKGTSAIKAVRFYLDNQDIMDFTASPGQNQLFTGGSHTNAGTHNLTVVAWDTANRVYKNSVNFGTYYDGNCPPKGSQGCGPGIFGVTPGDSQDVQSPFRIAGNVEFNTVPITNMKAYLDGKVVAQSFGPTLDQSIQAPKGTHILVFQAWDTQGKLYKVTENVNVQ